MTDDLNERARKCVEFFVNVRDKLTWEDQKDLRGLIFEALIKTRDEALEDAAKAAENSRGEEAERGLDAFVCEIKRVRGLSGEEIAGAIRKMKK